MRALIILFLFATIIHAVDMQKIRDYKQSQKEVQSKRVSSAMLSIVFRETHVKPSIIVHNYGAVLKGCVADRVCIYSIKIYNTSISKLIKKIKDENYEIESIKEHKKYNFKRL